MRPGAENGHRPGPRWAWCLAWGLIALGAGLRLRGYFADHSLWLDELMLARNFDARTLAGMFQPLEHGQNAPIAWRVLIKLLSMVFGSSEWVLRAVPAASSIATLPLLWWIGRRVLGARLGLVPLAMLAMGRPAIVYGIQFKQYASDALVAAALLAAALRWADRRDRRALITLGVIGIAGQLFSQPAIFVCAGVGSALLIHLLANRERPHLRPLGIVGVAWIVTFIANYLLFLRLPEDWQWAWLYDYWAHGFMPMPPTSVDQALWLPRALERTYQNVVSMYYIGLIGLIAMLAGIVALWRGGDRLALGVAGLPIVFTLIAGAMGQYPFAERLILFLAPSLILLAAASVRLVIGWGRPTPWRTAGGVVIFVLLLGPFFSSLEWLGHLRHPAHEANRPIVAALAERYQPGDRVVLPFWSRYAWWHYGPRLGLGAAPATYLERDEQRQARPLRQMLAEPTHAPRTWVLVTHYAQRPDESPDQFIAAATQGGRVTVAAQRDGAALLRIDH